MQPVERAARAARGQRQGHARGAAQHDAPLRLRLQHTRQSERREHRAGAEGGQGQGQGRVGQAEIATHEHHGVDQHHRAGRRRAERQRQQRAQSRCGQIDTAAARYAHPHSAFLGRLRHGQQHREDQDCRGDKADRGAGEQQRKTHHAQQCGGQQGRQQAFQIVGQPRQGQGFGVVPGIGQHVGNARLKGRRKRG